MRELVVLHSKDRDWLPSVSPSRTRMTIELAEHVSSAHPTASTKRREATVSAALVRRSQEIDLGPVSTASVSLDSALSSPLGQS